MLGDPNMLNGIFDGRHFKVVSNDEGIVSVEVGVEDQTDVNRIVDKLRKNGVSIVGMQAQRVSLEDAFLQLID